MGEVTLEVSRREGVGKGVATKLRAQGKIPAVVYGGHKEPVAITVDRKAVVDLIQKSDHGIRSIFLLKMAGSEGSAITKMLVDSCDVADPSPSTRLRMTAGYLFHSHPRGITPNWRRFTRFAA